MATIRPESPFNRVFVGASSDIVDVVPKSTGQRLLNDWLRNLQRIADEEINRRDWQKKFAEEESAKNANECVTKAMGTQASSDQTQTASTLATDSHSEVVCEEKTEIVPPVVFPDPLNEVKELHSKAVSIPKENPARHSSTQKRNYPISVHFRNVMWITIAASLLFFVSLSADKTREVLDGVSHTVNALVSSMKAGADRPTSFIAKEEQSPVVKAVQQPPKGEFAGNLQLSEDIVVPKGLSPTSFAKSNVANNQVSSDKAYSKKVPYSTKPLALVLDPDYDTVPDYDTE